MKQNNYAVNTWNRISLPDIRDMSALEVSPFHVIALYKAILTYLLTYKSVYWRNVKLF